MNSKFSNSFNQVQLKSKGRFISNTYRKKKPYATFKFLFFTQRHVWFSKFRYIMAVVDLQLLVQTLLYFCIFLSGFAISIPVGVNTVGKFFIVLYIIVNYDWWNHIYTTHIWDMCFILLSFLLLPFTLMFSSLFIMEYCKKWRYIVEDLVFYVVCCSFTCISCFDHCMFTFVLC